MSSPRPGGDAAAPGGSSERSSPETRGAGCLLRRRVGHSVVAAVFLTYRVRINLGTRKDEKLKLRKGFYSYPAGGVVTDVLIVKKVVPAASLCCECYVEVVTQTYSLGFWAFRSRTHSLWKAKVLLHATTLQV